MDTLAILVLYVASLRGSGAEGRVLIPMTEEGRNPSIIIIMSLLLNNNVCSIKVVVAVVTTDDPTLHRVDFYQNNWAGCTFFIFITMCNLINT